MANPNRSVFLARNRVLELVSERSFDSLNEARRYRDFNKRQQNGTSADRTIYRITSYKTGPKDKPLRHYVVRGYRK